MIGVGVVGLPFGIVEADQPALVGRPGDVLALVVVARLVTLVLGFELAERPAIGEPHQERLGVAARIAGLRRTLEQLVVLAGAALVGLPGDAVASVRRLGVDDDALLDLAFRADRDADVVGMARRGWLCQCEIG